MFCVVGLGNLGEQYSGNRHNIGFRLIDKLAEQAGTDIRRRAYRALTATINVGRTKVLLLKPQTYMNNSGRSVAAAYAAGGFAIDHLVVAFDDMDLPLGRLRLRVGGGSGGHNGLRSVVNEVGESDFVRLRLGVGRPASGIDPADHVLGGFDSSQEATAEEAIERATKAIEILILQGPVAAMNECNKKTSPEA